MQMAAIFAKSIVLVDDKQRSIRRSLATAPFFSQPGSFGGCFIVGHGAKDLLPARFRHRGILGFAGLDLAQQFGEGGFDGRGVHATGCHEALRNATAGIRGDGLLFQREPLSATDACSPHQ